MNHISNVGVFDSPEQLALAAAERFVEAATNHPDRVSVALAGGNTPRRVYELLASEPFKNRIEWSHVHLIFGDERCVPPSHTESNYRMVYDALISQVPIPPENVKRIAGEGDPGESARAYEDELKQFFPNRAWPRFDLVFLGMGEDGHTASLFPESAALRETARWVVATRKEGNNEELLPDRITLTLPAINHAAYVIFLVTGEKKAQRLSEVLRPKHEQEPLPAQLIKPYDGKLEWLVDAAAARFL